MCIQRLYISHAPTLQRLRCALHARSGIIRDIRLSAFCRLFVAGDETNGARIFQGVVFVLDDAGKEYLGWRALYPTSNIVGIYLITASG